MRTIVKTALKVFISLQLTVTLLGFAILLVFIGTLAQVDEGLYNAQAHYFHQWLVFGIDLFGWRAPLPLPGGYLIGTMLLLNLIAAHLFRFQLSVKKIGIQLAHLGIILLLVGQLATDMLARESQMHFAEGETRGYAENPRNNELAITSNSLHGGQDVVAIPARLLAQGGEIQNQNIPFKIRVKSYWPNSTPAYRPPLMRNAPPLAANGIATNFDFTSSPESKNPEDRSVPTALIEIIGPAGSLGAWVVSGWASDQTMADALRESYERQVGTLAQTICAQLTEPQSVQIGGKKFTFGLRPERIYFPFSLQLLKATHTVYEGTIIPKDFRSLVRLRNPQSGEDRDVEISMNHPLRYAGLTLYQYQMDAGQAAALAGRAPSSVLQIVRNPSWLTPYIGCGMVASGLTIQFLIHLIGFLSKRRPV